MTAEQPSTLNQTVPSEEIHTSTAHTSQQGWAGRPTGVGVLSILMILGGILDVTFAALILVLPSIQLTPLNVTLVLQFAGLPTILISSVLAGSGVVLVILAYGLWIGRRWAWYWTLLSAIVSLIASAIGMIAEIGFGLGVIFYPIILFYLTRARVKNYFER